MTEISAYQICPDEFCPLEHGVFETRSHKIRMPPSTPALEVRVVPIKHLYVKSMVEAEDRIPFAHNPTGFVPQFRGVPIGISEIGFSPGKKASSVRAFDNVEIRRGYSGLYQFGASYNPGKFTTPTHQTKSGNYLLYLDGPPGSLAR
jgi:hypothetical protein